MPGWQDFDVAGAGMEGWASAQTIQSDIQGRRIDVEQKKVDLDSSRKTLEQQTTLIDAMKAAGPGVGDTPTARAADALWKASQAAASVGDVQDADKAANSAAGILQNEAYAESIKLQRHQSTIKDMVTGLGTVHDEASWQEFAKTFEKTHPPEGEFGSMGLFKDSNGNLYPYSADRVDALRNGGMTGLQRVQADLVKEKEKSEAARRRQIESTIDLNKHRAAELDARRDKLKKGGATHLAPKAADIKLITDLAREDGVDDSGDPQVASALRAKAAEAAENIPQYRTQGMSAEQAARAAYADAKKQHVFTGLPTIRERESQIKGSRERPATIPLGKGGKPDLSKLKADSFVMGTGKYKGQLLYWDGKTMSLAQDAPSALGEGDDEGDDGSD